MNSTFCFSFSFSRISYTSLNRAMFEAIVAKDFRAIFKGKFFFLVFVLHVFLFLRDRLCFISNSRLCSIRKGDAWHEFVRVGARALTVLRRHVYPLFGVVSTRNDTWLSHFVLIFLFVCVCVFFFGLVWVVLLLFCCFTVCVNVVCKCR